jgi:hypothetical protein
MTRGRMGGIAARGELRIQDHAVDFNTTNAPARMVKGTSGQQPALVWFGTVIIMGVTSIVTMTCCVVATTVLGLPHFDYRELAISVIASWIPCVLSPIPWSGKVALCVTLTPIFVAVLFAYSFFVVFVLTGNSL